MAFAVFFLAVVVCWIVTLALSIFGSVAFAAALVLGAVFGTFTIFLTFALGAVFRLTVSRRPGRAQRVTQGR